MPNFELTSMGPLTVLLRKKRIDTWNDALSYLRTLPYGRNKDRECLQNVILEEKGTCSSKHAFASQVAIENDIMKVKLICGIYKMNGNNTPKTKDILSKYQLSYIPEFHCYLNVNGKYIDITNSDSDHSKIEKYKITEFEIVPEFVFKDKIIAHKLYLENWVTKNEIPYSLEELWKIREQCIASLSQC